MSKLSGSHFSSQPVSSYLLTRGRRQGAKPSNSPPPFRVPGVMRFDSNICILEDSERPRPWRRPLPKVIQKATKNQTSNLTAFFSENGIPRGPTGHLKSQKIIPSPPRERMGKPSHRVPEKTGSWTLPSTSPCLSRTMPAMLLTRSARCLWLTLFVTLSIILAPFLSPWAPKG